MLQALQTDPMAAQLVLGPEPAEVSAGLLELGRERGGFGAVARTRGVDAEGSQR
jgi:hypothetical protein